jgi:hypothetical protein
MTPTLSPLDRLVALAAEAEQIIAKGIVSHDIRQVCAVARGYVELARSYGEPISMEAVEGLLVRLNAGLKTALAGSGGDETAALKYEGA